MPCWVNREFLQQVEESNSGYPLQEFEVLDDFFIFEFGWKDQEGEHSM